MKVDEARSLLSSLGFDAERSNSRSALVLLALLKIKQDDDWADSTNPSLGTRQIMDWIRDEYGVDYAPNTRETIRRFTLHQFADALLVEENPDEPNRPVNSPNWCYAINAEAVETIKSFGTDAWVIPLANYLAARLGLRERYAAARAMNRIPVTLPGGKSVVLSPGGQNVLIKQMVEEFCAYFTPGGFVLYVGDADTKWAYFDCVSLEALGVTIDSHGKMPDLVVYLEDRNWLVLSEAVASHGPVDATRHGELASLFAGSTAGLVYVSCFPNRAEMRKYLTSIAWETEAWCADNPTHLIHFNGKDFLGLTTERPKQHLSVPYILDLFPIIIANNFERSRR